jgi:hypothetical protein
MKKKFSLWELFLSIIGVVFIGIMIIPFINSLFRITEEKVFEEMLNNISEKTMDDYNKYYNGSTYDCVIYDIRKDLPFDNLGTYEGYSIVKDDSVYLSIHNKSFIVTNLLFVNKNNIIESASNFNDESFNVDELVTNLKCKDYTMVEK